VNRNPELKVPYTLTGDLMHHPGPGHVDGDHHLVYKEVGAWRDNEVFEATLQLKGTERGRSAAFFRWQEVNAERMFPMFITDMCHLIHLAPNFRAGGVISARWFVAKRGQNYGITPLEVVVASRRTPIPALDAAIEAPVLGSGGVFPAL
jgi:hypothetical protein